MCFSFLIALSQTVTTAESLPQPEKILLLRQITSFNGPVSTYISKDAVKVCFTTLHGHLIAKAPTWKVVLVNDDDKSSFEIEYEAWLKRKIVRTYMSTDDMRSDNRMPLLDVSTVTYAGRSCRQCTFDGYQFRGKFFGIARTGVANEKACLILEKWFATPFVDCIPVAFKYCNQQDNFISEVTKKRAVGPTIIGSYCDPLECTKIEFVDYQKNFFSYPKGYKRLDSEVAVFSSTRQKDMVEDLFRDGIMKK